MKHFLVYTVLRLLLFVGCLVVVSTIAVNVFDNTTGVWIWCIVGAAVLSSVLSIFLLQGPRERFAESVQRRAHRAGEALERSRSKEDVD